MNAPSHAAVAESSGHRLDLRVALLDWDNTLHSGFTMRSWVSYLLSLGYFAASPAHRMERLFADFERGRLSYQDLDATIAGLYAAGLQEVDSHQLRAAGFKFADLNRHLLFPFTVRLLQHLGTAGIRSIVVSSCPQEVLEGFQRRLGIDEMMGLRVEVRAGGWAPISRAGPEMLPHSKQAAVDLLEGAVYLAAGDSVADLPLLRAARHKIVVGPQALLPNDPQVLRLRPEMSSAAELICELESTLDRWGMGSA